MPQAFPFYDPSLIELILELDARAYDKYLCTRNFSDGSSRRVFDPFYALSIVAVGVGTVGKEHLKAMRQAFPAFAHKYFAIEDSIWPFFWMLPEQMEQGGRIIELERIWPAKEQAEQGMIEYMERISGIKLIAGRPTITEARRVTDFKYNVFLPKSPAGICSGNLLYNRGP